MTSDFKASDGRVSDESDGAPGAAATESTAQDGAPPVVSPSHAPVLEFHSLGSFNEEQPRSRDTESECERPKPYGRGIMLFFFCFSCIVGNPVMSTVEFANFAMLYSNASSDFLSEHSGLVGMIRLEHFASLVLIPYGFVTGLLVWWCRKQGKLHANIIVAVSLAMNFLFLASGHIIGSMKAAYIGGLIWSIIWLLYFNLSRRIKNTFDDADRYSVPVCKPASWISIVLVVVWSIFAALIWVGSFVLFVRGFENA